VNRRFEFDKPSQLLIRVNNETLSVAVCVKRDHQRNRLRDAQQPSIVP
jgi:hypothetical protein